jgi:hypothetical protein
MKSKANQIYLKQEKKSKMRYPYITKKLIAKILYMSLQFWGGLMSFHPQIGSLQKGNIHFFK